MSVVISFLKPTSLFLIVYSEKGTWNCCVAFSPSLLELNDTKGVCETVKDFCSNVFWFLYSEIDFKGYQTTTMKIYEMFRENSKNLRFELWTAHLKHSTQLFSSWPMPHLIIIAFVFFLARQLTLSYYHLDISFCLIA